MNEREEIGTAPCLSRKPDLMQCIAREVEELKHEIIGTWGVDGRGV